MKRKITYKETYKPGRLPLHQDELPILRHTGDDYTAIVAEVTAAGVYDDGTEFQLLKVVLAKRSV